MPDTPSDHVEIERATRAAVRDILLGDEGQMLLSRVAEAASKATITDFMLKIGMDTTSSQSIIALQLDMQHLRWWNAFVASGTGHILAALILLTTTGALVTMVLGLKTYFSH